MKFSPELAAEKLDGFLLAVSSLKDDGTFFRVFFLGEMPPEQSLAALCNSLAVPVEDFYFVSFAESIQSSETSVPTLLKHWILSRRRIFNPKDSEEIDPRLFDGFIAELDDLLGRQDHWLELRRSGSSRPHMQMGALWDLLVLGVKGGSFAIHCSWDS